MMPNRKQRRAAGFRGPAYTHTSSDSRPRFVRRHLAPTLFSLGNTTSPTRRVRKAAARIKREAYRLGLF